MDGRRAYAITYRARCGSAFHGFASPKGVVDRYVRYRVQPCVIFFGPKRLIFFVWTYPGDRFASPSETHPPYAWRWSQA